MPNNSAYLRNFIYPIPICQSGADVGSILHIFHHSNCKVLAIPLDNQNWGIINSGDLLPFLATAWSGARSALVGHPRNMTYQQGLPHFSIQDFNSIVKPAMVFQADTNLDDFLNCLEYKSRFNNQNEYLVVDAAGELQGQIDFHEVIKYLALESKYSTTNNLQKSPSFNNLSSLIDSVPLPLKLETATKQELYLNQYWQQIFTHKQNFPPVDKTDTQIASWWLKQQDDRNLDNDSEVELSLASNFSSTIELEQVLDWNYLRVPLTPEEQLSGEDKPCYLVFATKIPLTALSNPNKVDSQTVSSSTNSLLGTVSHELKSPLTGIVGLSSLLQGQKLGSLNQRQARYVKLIQRSGKRMMGIVDDLLKLTSLAAEPAPAPELVDLELLCRQLGHQISTKIQSTDTEDLNFRASVAQLKLDIELGTEIAIANKSTLSLVLNHLLWEIIRLCEPEEPLEIKIFSLRGHTAITISCNLNERSPSLLVSDSPSSPDSGLDLVIAKYLAIILQGSITTDHSANRCQFTLLLPKKSQHQQPDPHADNSISIAKVCPNLTILCLYPELDVIDPHAHHRNDPHFDLKSLSDNGTQQLDLDCQHRIIEADSLEQAHNLARIWQLDVLILDGYQIINPQAYLRLLQASKPLSVLPLITLDTGTTEAANQIEGLNVYPCLLPAKHRSIGDLMQVIKIATET